MRQCAAIRNATALLKTGQMWAGSTSDTSGLVHQKIPEQNCFLLVERTYTEFGIRVPLSRYQNSQNDHN